MAHCNRPACAERHFANCGHRNGRHLRTARSGVSVDQYRMERIAGPAAGGTGREDPSDAVNAPSWRPPSTPDHLLQRRNLLLAKGISRSHEIAVRAAIGAGRARILRQLVTESMVLATLGGAVGLGLATRGIALVRSFGDGLIPRANEIHLSGPVALFAVAATVVTALIFGLATAQIASRVDLREHIRFGDQGPTLT